MIKFTCTTLGEYDGFAFISVLVFPVNSNNILLLVVKLSILQTKNILHSVNSNVSLLFAKLKHDGPFNWIPFIFANFAPLLFKLLSIKSIALLNLK